MTRNKIVLVVIFVQFLNNIFLTLASPDERRLIKHLLKNYEPDERPVFNHREPVNVKLGLTIQKLDLDDDAGVLKSMVWLNMEWDDFNLKWNESEYGGIKDIRLPPQKIWVPDIFPYNAENPSRIAPKSGVTNIVVTSNGSCTYVPPMDLQTTCKIDFNNRNLSF